MSGIGVAYEDRKDLPMSEHKVQVGRVYDARAREDGTRVLVDRLWPRGLSKAAADIDEWCKGVAPSAELRTWYGHDPEKFAEFTRRYRAELDDPAAQEVIEHLRALARQGNITLLTGSKEVDLSDAVVLAELLGE